MRVLTELCVASWASLTVMLISLSTWTTRGFNRSGTRCTNEAFCSGHAGSARGMSEPVHETPFSRRYQKRRTVIGFWAPAQSLPARALTNVPKQFVNVAVLLVGIATAASISACETGQQPSSNSRRLSIDTPVQGSLAEPFSDERWNYEGKRGETVAVEANSERFDTEIQLTSPTGNEIAHDDDGGLGLNSRLVATLPENGDYRVTVTAFGDGFGAYHLAVRSSTLATLTIDQSPVRATFDGPNDGHWTFEGREGQTIVVEATSKEFDTRIQLTSPTGYEIGQDDDGGLGLNSRLVATLPENGDYRVTVTALTDGLGDYELLARSVDVKTLGVNQPPESGIFNGPNDGHWNFEGRGGQTVVVEASSEDFDTVIQLTSPTGDDISWNDDSRPDSTDSQLVANLREDGTYSITVTAFDRHTGTYRLAVRSVDVERLEIDIPTGGRLTGPNDGYWIFEGTKGQTVSVEANSIYFDTIVALTSPAGAEITRNDDADSSSTDSRLVAILPEDGEYGVTVTAFGSSLGTYEVAVRSMNIPSLETDKVASGTLGGGSSDGQWIFWGNAEQAISVEVNSDVDTVVQLTSPAGREIARDFDTVVQLTSPAGREIARDDDGPDPIRSSR